MIKANQVKERYTAPQIKIFCTNVTCHIMDTSFPGQHKKAEKGGEIKEDPAGQNDAKRSFFSDWD